MTEAAAQATQHRRLTQAEVDVICVRHDRLWSSRMGGARAVFTWKDLSGLDLSGRNLCDGDFTGPILADCHISNARLDNATLFGADLQNANLREASLRRADLRGACLRGADLSGANLRDAVLVGCKTVKWNVQDANLSGVLTDEPAGRDIRELPFDEM